MVRKNIIAQKKTRRPASERVRLGIMVLARHAGAFGHYRFTFSSSTHISESQVVRLRRIAYSHVYVCSYVRDSECTLPLAIDQLKRA